MGYACMEYLNLSEYITVFHVRPLPVFVLCWLLLGEGITWIQILTGGRSILSSPRGSITDSVGPVVSFASVLLVVSAGSNTNLKTDMDVTEILGAVNSEQLIGILLALGTTITSAFDR